MCYHESRLNSDTQFNYCKKIMSYYNINKVKLKMLAALLEDKRKKVNVINVRKKSKKIQRFMQVVETFQKVFNN